jgi:hypothetical protein
MKRLMLAICLAVTATALLGASARAQVVETPVPFDSTGRITTVTPGLVTRLKLAPPEWPVRDDFVEARLYSRGDAGFVLVVQRRGGTLERFELTAGQGDRLRAAVVAATQTAGRPASEERSEVLSEPARGAFIRNQTSLGALLYGPALSMLTNDGKSASAIWLLTAGTTFFVTSSLVKHIPVTRAQNFLATDAAGRGAIAGAALMFVATGKEARREAYALAVFGGGVGGSMAGFAAGRPLTDGEAHAMGLGSTVATLTTLGLLGSAGVFTTGRRTTDKARVITATSVTALVAGYPLGLLYPRRASYTITAGDVNLLGTTSTLGAALALGASLVPNDIDPRTAYGLVTAGYLAGLVAGDRLLVRPYDHTEAEGMLIGLGAGAGAMMGLAVEELATPTNTGVQVLIPTAGAAVGLLLTENLVEPHRASRVGALRRAGLRVGTGPRAPTIEFSPTNALFAAARMPGAYSLVHLRF